MLLRFEENEDVFHSMFRSQLGGMPKYRGSPMAGGSFWGRIIGFAKGLFSKAAPHISNMISQAQPHVKKDASRAVKTAIDSAVDHVADKLKKAQQGNGIKGRKRRVIPIKAKRKTRKKIKRLREPILKHSLL